MKIVIIYGQSHKGSTYHITRQIVDNIDNKADIIEFFMPKDTPEFCVGCFSCILKSEHICPHAGKVQKIIKEMESADLIVLSSPCYCFGMTGQLKTLLDHFAYIWLPHRPRETMFKKVGLVVSTAAGAGAKKTNKAMKDNMTFWGISNVFSYSKNVNASSYDTISKKIKTQIENKTAILSKKISLKLDRVKPNIQIKFLFKIMRLSQKSNNWNEVDKNYWKEKGWLKSNRPWRKSANG